MKTIATLAFTASLIGASCNGASSPAAPGPSVNATEPTAQDLLRAGRATLREIGRDPDCFDFRIVDRTARTPEVPKTTRPAYKSAIYFLPARCPTEYCLEFEGMASRSMSWCLDQRDATAAQQHAIQVAYARFRDEHPGVSKLETFLVFADEQEHSVNFEFVGRKDWADVPNGIIDGPMYLIAKSELGLPDALPGASVAEPGGKQ